MENPASPFEETREVAVRLAARKLTPEQAAEAGRAARGKSRHIGPNGATSTAIDTATCSSKRRDGCWATTALGCISRLRPNRVNLAPSIMFTPPRRRRATRSKISCVTCGSRTRWKYFPSKRPTAKWSLKANPNQASRDLAVICLNMGTPFFLRRCGRSQASASRRCRWNLTIIAIPRLTNLSVSSAVPCASAQTGIA